MVRLEGGETRQTTIEITHDDLLIFNEQSGARQRPRGEFEFRAALSPRDAHAADRVQVTSSASSAHHSDHLDRIRP